jgi:hypothetical protein
MSLTLLSYPSEISLSNWTRNRLPALPRRAYAGRRRWRCLDLGARALLALGHLRSADNFRPARRWLRCRHADRLAVYAGTAGRKSAFGG